MKKPLIHIIAIILLCSLSFISVQRKDIGDQEPENQSESDGTSSKKRLSEMTDDELKTFLSEYVPLYEGDKENQDLMFRFLKRNLDEFDSAGPTPKIYGYTLYWTWTEEIDKGIKAYYGEGGIT